MNISCPASAPKAGRPYYIAMLLAFMGFILIASLPPANNPFGDYHAWNLLGQLDFGKMLSRHDLRDTATNVLLYLPLGVLAGLLAAYGRRFWGLGWLILGPILSLSVELAQPLVQRFSDPVDVLNNSIGYWLGFAMVYVAVRRFGLSPGRLIGFSDRLTQHQKGQTLAALRFIYVVLLLIVGLLPFDISVRLAAVYDQLLPNWEGDLRIVLDPRYHFARWPGESLKLLLEFLMTVPLGFLTTLLERLHGRRGLAAAIVNCVLVVMVVELAQVFVMSRTSDVTLLILAPAGGLIGWGSAWVVHKLVPGWDLPPTAGDSVRSPSPWGKMAVLFLIGYCLILCLLAWFPYRFELDPIDVLRKIRYHSNWVPFRAHFAVRNIWTALDLVEEMVLFMPLGAIAGGLLRTWRPMWGQAAQLLAVSGGCMLLAGALEVTQAACVDRFVDVSDILLAGVGSILGSVISKPLFYRTTSGGGA